MQLTIKYFIIIFYMLHYYPIIIEYFKMYMDILSKIVQPATIKIIQYLRLV